MNKTTEGKNMDKHAIDLNLETQPNNQLIEENATSSKKLTASKLLDLGYTPVSIIPPGAKVSEKSSILTKDLGKVPGVVQFPGTDKEYWAGYAWQNAKPDISDAEYWDKSNANIGILAAYTPAFDCDVDDEELSAKLVAEIERICGTAVKRKSRFPRNLLIYRIEEPLEKLVVKFNYKDLGEQKVEFLGKGRQFVVSGKHPSGVMYEIENMPQAGKLTCITVAQVAEALEAIRKCAEGAGADINNSVRKKALVTDFRTDDLSLTTARKVDLTFDKITAIVNDFDPDVHYDDWVKIGMALHAQFGGEEAGFNIWNVWSAKGEKYKTEEMKAKWQSFDAKKTGIGFATIIHMHKALKNEKQKERGPHQALGEKHDTIPYPKHIVVPKKISDLLRTDFPPLKWVVQDILPEGIYLLVAQPKFGKSWLALQLCHAVATGTNVLGKKVEKGAALYLALEDSKRRMKQRMEHFPLSNDDFVYETEWPQEADGGTASIDAWLSKNKSARLVVIDTLQMFCNVRNNQKNGVYSEDYKMVRPIRDLANKHGISILVVHHMRKNDGKFDVPWQEISGSNGIFGAVDGALMLTGKSMTEAKLHVDGRDISDNCSYSLIFDKERCLWVPKSGSDLAASADAISTEQSAKVKILNKMLQCSALIFHPEELSKELGINYSTARGVMSELKKEGKLELVGKGKYAISFGYDELFGEEEAT